MEKLLVLLCLIATFQICLSLPRITLDKNETEINIQDNSTDFNGEPSNIYSAPWIVSIQLNKLIGLNKTLTHHCVGTILNQNSILTSIECVSHLPDATQLIIAAGPCCSSNFTSYRSNNRQFVYPFTILRNNEWINENTTIGIAVIKLNSKLIFNGFVQRLYYNASFYADQNHKVGYQFGYASEGITVSNSSLEIKTVNLTNTIADCSSAIFTPFFKHLCVKITKCSKDGSGSPLIVYDEDNIPHLWGIWHRDDCSNPIQPTSIFTPISDFKHWITYALSNYK